MHPYLGISPLRGRYPLRDPQAFEQAGTGVAVDDELADLGETGRVALKTDSLYPDHVEAPSFVGCAVPMVVTGALLQATMVDSRRLRDGHAREESNLNKSSCNNGVYWRRRAVPREIQAGQWQSSP